MSQVRYFSIIFVFASLLILPGFVFGQTTNIKPPSPANVLPEVVCTQQYDPVCGVDNRTYANACIAEKVFKVPIKHKGACAYISAKPSPALPAIPEPPANTVAPPSQPSPQSVKQCGLNTYHALNQCGNNAFKRAYVQCYDGYEETLGSESSCKASDVWIKYGREICANRCGMATTALQSVPESGSLVPQSPPQPSITAKAKPIPICYIPDKLTKDYNRLILELQKAEGADDKELAESVIQKITALKPEIERARKECLTSTGPAAQLESPPSELPPSKPPQLESPPSKLPQPTVPPRETVVPAPLAVDRCLELKQWQNKITYYERLADLNDEELKAMSGFSREDIEKILAELPQGLSKVKAQCDEQEAVAAKPLEAMEAEMEIIAVPVKPVAVESGQEVIDYYKAKIEEITSKGNVEEQVAKLKSLKTEIDELIARLIKGRKEIEASELDGLVSEVKVSRGEIKADNVAIKTTDKKILVNINQKPVSVVPGAGQVIIQDENLKVKAKEISIKEKAVFVGDSEVRFAASQVAENLGISPKEADLEEKDGRAAYNFKVAESRKLFGFIPIAITKTVTADAASSDFLAERLPWWSFLTTR